MQFDLIPHPTSPPADPPFRVWASVEHAGAFGAVATTNIWFGVSAPVDRFVIPAAAPRRADGLWQSTCFEAFLRGVGKRKYREWNFAPSGQWAAYDFSGTRKGMKNADIAAPPYVRMEDNFTWWSLGATFTVETGHAWELGLSAVIEEKDGTKSYWALAHPNAEEPDFHDPGCFAARLP